MNFLIKNEVNIQSIMHDVAYLKFINELIIYYIMNSNFKTWGMETGPSWPEEAQHTGQPLNLMGMPLTHPTVFSV